MKPGSQLTLASSVFCCLLLSACGSDSDSDSESNADSDAGSSSSTEPDPDASSTTNPDIDTSTTTASLDPTLFVEDALASEPTIVECTLNDGTVSTCYEIITVGVPADSAVGPFCPQTINTGSDESGIWLDGTGIVYEANGDFIVDLPNIYGDATWQLYDTVTGEVNITDTQEGCEAAARPDVDPEYVNHCVECSLDYYDGGISSTFLIPVNPSMAESPNPVSQAGVTLNGVQMAGPAPVDDILSNYTIAAFDDCGGHVNPNEGYHYHAATGCTEAVTQDDGHAALMGYAMDGYGIYAMLDSEGAESTGLDECRGQTDDIRGYHYHAASAGENMFIGCLSGKVEGVAATDGPPGGGPPR